MPCCSCHVAEEFALHKIIDQAKDDWESGDEAQEDSLAGLPCSTMDEDFDAVSEAAFQDEDVLMLFDMPQGPAGCRKGCSAAVLGVLCMVTYLVESTARASQCNQLLMFTCHLLSRRNDCVCRFCPRWM
jgi:hypothetical protein